MTIMDGREPTKRKLFDFTVFNPSKQTQCSVQECELSYFENVAEGGVKLAYTDLRKDSSVPIHSSEFGKHWEKGTKEKHKQDP